MSVQIDVLLIRGSDGQSIPTQLVTTTEKHLAATGYGFHLNWEMLTVYETEHDWYQCDRCQQVVQVPELSQISDPKLNIYACRAYRCTGVLKPYSATQIKERSEQHYQQYLIGNTNRIPLPLRSQEHTAQLGTEELAKRENDFRQGKINLLSCSTTLEMGVDIGELQAVVLRNFPPHVSNYQQRAGRAGRRTDGVALTLMYGQRRPHDRYYFEQPEQLIAGSNQIPRLDPDNLQIQERHIRAELLATFLASQNLGTEQVLIGTFFGLSDEEPLIVADGHIPMTSMLFTVEDLVIW